MTYTNGPRIVTNGLVLHLDAGNTKSYSGSGTVWNDLSGNGNNGTLTNGPSYNAANKGSIVFDGTNDYITGFSNVSVNISSPFSCEIWFNLTSYSDTYPTLMQIKTNTTNAVNMSLSQQASYLGIIFGSASTWARIKTDNPPLIQKWNHIILTYNGAGAGTTTNYQIILNNTIQTLSSAAGFATTTQTNYIGSLNAASRGIDDFIGNISICKIYNRALSANEVSQNYNALKGRYNL